MRRNRVVVGHVLLSSLAAAMLLLATWTSEPTRAPLDPLERSIIALTFMGSCAAGILLVVRPRISFMRSGKKGARNPDGSTGRSMIGHHPDCGRFSNSIILVRGRARCTGCLGLAIGCASALGLMGAFILMPPVGSVWGRWFVIMGLIIVSFCMVEVAWHPPRPGLHVLSNAALVIGFLLVTVGTASVASDILSGLVAILICYLWLDTRIQLSDRRNAWVCESCSQACKFY